MTSPPLLRRELCERSAIVVLQHGANALDDELLTALAAELEALIAAGGPPLVLHSAHSPHRHAGATVSPRPSCVP